MLSLPWCLQSHWSHSCWILYHFSKLQCYTTLALLFCLAPSVLSLHLRYLTSVYRGFGFSAPASFSPGAIGALLFPAAFHAPQKGTVFEPAFGLIAKPSLCEAWKTRESSGAAPRDRWKRSWLGEISSQAVPHLTQTNLATKSSSGQLSGLKSCCWAWREEQLELPGKPLWANVPPSCAPQGHSQGLTHAPCLWRCHPAPHQTIWLTRDKSSRMAKPLMSLLFLVPDSSYKIFQVCVDDITILNWGLFVITCQLDKLKTHQSTKQKVILLWLVLFALVSSQIRTLASGMAILKHKSLFKSINYNKSTLQFLIFKYFYNS